MQKRGLLWTLLLFIILSSPVASGAEQITSPSQLAGKKIGIMTGTSFDGVAQRQLPDSEAVYYNTYADMTEALKAGQIAAFIMDEPAAKELSMSAEGITYLNEYLETESYAYVFNKDSAALCDAVNAIILRLKEDGAIQSLEDKWFASNESLRVMPEYTLTGENGTLRLATDGESPPFVYLRDNELVGIDMEIVYMIMQELGYSIDMERLSTAGIIAGIISGRYDFGFGLITITEERKQNVLFSEPLYEGGAVAVVLDGSPATTTGLGFWASMHNSFYRTFVEEGRYRLILEGLGVTVLLSLASALFGTAGAFGLCLLRRSRHGLLRALAHGFVMIFQGIPMVVVLMILNFLVFRGASVNGIVVGIVGFSFNFAAYASEIMRSGLDALDGGQLEAAAALGFSKMQIFRNIIFPQTARQIMPVYMSEIISMVKMTSVVGYVAIQDLTKVSDIIRSRTFEAFFPLITTALIYFAIAHTLAALVGLVEYRINPRYRKRIVKGVQA